MYGLRYRSTQPNVFRVAGIEPFNDPEVAFAAAVRAGRQVLGLTQDQVRRRLLDNFGIDISKTAMSRLEQGERPIRFNEVAALAHILKIELLARSPKTAEAEGMDLVLAQTSARLAAVETELEIASAAHAEAVRAAEMAADRLHQVQRTHRELRSARDRLLDSLNEMSDVGKRFELLRENDGDR